MITNHSSVYSHLDSCLVSWPPLYLWLELYPHIPVSGS